MLGRERRVQGATFPSSQGRYGSKASVDTYDEYGIPASGNSGRLQYTGQAYLSEIGLSYYKARIYSPTLGRFMQTDPIGYDDGLNWYAYVHSDPVNRADPSGMADHGPYDPGNNTHWDCPPGTICLGTVYVPGRSPGDTPFDSEFGPWFDPFGWGNLFSGTQFSSGFEPGRGPLGGLRFPTVPASVNYFNHPMDSAQTGRAAQTMEEQLAVEEAHGNPSASLTLPIQMNDPRWPSAGGWVKKQWTHRSMTGGIVVVHFLYNTVTGQMDDFKIVNP